MFSKKSIVLSDVESSSNRKAVLTIEEVSGGLKGSLRLYNFNNELAGISSLGFYIDKKVIKAGLTFKSHMLYEFFIDLNSIPQKFSCAVINFQNAQASPILYGSSNGSDDEIYASIINEISQENSFKNTKNVLDKYDVDFQEDEKAEIEKEIDKAMCQDCGNCVYKKYFYEHNPNVKAENLKEEKSETVEDNIYEMPKHEEPVNENLDFFLRLKPQIDKLFSTNPIEDNLQKLIPSSKFIKVEYEDDGDFYVFGLLYDNDENIKYVCYGVPAVFEENPPDELSGYPIWLPLDKDNAKGFGYWLTYQDASTGEPVKAIIDWGDDESLSMDCSGFNFAYYFRHGLLSCCGRNFV